MTRATNETRERLRAVVRGRLESLERAGVQQLPKARLRAERVEIPAAVATANESVAGKAVAAPSASVRSPTEAVVSEPLSMPALERVQEETPMTRQSVASKPASPAIAPPTTKTAASGWARTKGLFDDGTEATIPASDAPTLEILQQEVVPCVRCKELATTRTQTVFGVGNPKARLCFMGEAPGADEDRLGEPFVGRAGQLLNKIIEACRLKREDVYILNMLKCRPPGNRNPLPDELVNCRPFLERQLELVEPEFICCLGAVASQNLLGVATPIGKLRGKLHQYRGAKVVCTFHPAYLLRNPAAKKDCWEDMKLLMREMGVEL